MKIKPIKDAWYKISDGDAGIYETVDYMWNYALRDVSEPLVKKLVRSLQGKNSISTIKNIYDWVWKNVEYKLDPPDREMITAPIHFVNGNSKTGDCDCMTTLLVCLLESAGFDCAITVIAWRVREYTHVFAEVWHNNSWHILDPTLKNAGFGEQDKKIKRYKRITKKEMAKLQVLADSQMAANYPLSAGDEETTRGNNFRAKRLIRNRGRCYGNDDNNKNTNNININFGTNVENSHNSEENRSVDNREFSRNQNDFQRTVAPHPQTIFRPNNNNNYDGKNSTVATEYRASGGENKTVDKKIIMNNKRPKFVPNTVKNYYPEFP
jgi:hypothetical protein